MTCKRGVVWGIVLAAVVLSPMSGCAFVTAEEESCRNKGALPALKSVLVTELEVVELKLAYDCDDSGTLGYEFHIRPSAHDAEPGWIRNHCSETTNDPWDGEFADIYDCEIQGMNFALGIGEELSHGFLAGAAQVYEVD